MNKILNKKSIFAFSVFILTVLASFSILNTNSTNACSITDGCLNLQNNHRPMGYLDGIVGDSAGGWSLDNDDQTRSVSVHFYIDGEAGKGGTYIGSTVANLSRPDISKVYKDILNTNHGYWFKIPEQYMNDGRTHSIYAYGIDLTPNSQNSLLSGNPKTFTGGSTNPPTTQNPVIRVTSPSSGESFREGDTITIRWNSTGFSPSKVNIIWNVGAGNWNVIAQNVIASNNSYSWKVNTNGNRNFSIAVFTDELGTGKRVEGWASNLSIVAPTSPVVVNPTIVQPQIIYTSPSVAYPYYSNYNYNNYSSLSVSCYPNITNSYLGNNVLWTANVSGGNGIYSYYWSGTDMYGGSNSNTINTNYNNPGYKTASVTVTSNGQSITQSCSNSVNVANSYQYNTNYYQNNINQNGNLQVACYADKKTVRIGSPVTWAVEVLGGVMPYSYSWSGSEGLSSNQYSAVTTYDSVGTKSAKVTIVSANGQTITQSCGNTVYVSNVNSYQNNSNLNQYQNPQFNNADQYRQDNSLSAASLFSLNNVPWGWVAVLVILTLMFTVIYLLFNRNKI